MGSEMCIRDRLDADGDGKVTRGELLEAVDLLMPLSASGASPPAPMAAGQVLMWNGVLYVAIHDPKSAKAAQRARSHRAAVEAQLTAKLVWTLAPSVSPSGHKSIHDDRSTAGQ